MVERRICSFCGHEIEAGTGRMYILKDGTIYQFCRKKCFKNLIVLRRVPRRTRWTAIYQREKAIRLRGLRPAEEEAKAPPARAPAKKARVPKKAAPKVAAEAKERAPAEAPEAEVPAPPEEVPEAAAEEAPKKRRARKVAKPAEGKPAKPRTRRAAKKEES